MKKLVPLLALALACFSACDLIHGVEKGEGTVEPGCDMTLSNNYCRNHTVFSAIVRPQSDFDCLTIGRGGPDVYWGAWAVVTRDSVSIYERDYLVEKGDYDNVLFDSFPHGLTLGNQFAVSIVTSAPDSTGVFVITSGTKSFKKKIHWRGGGVPYFTNNGTHPLDVSLFFVRRDADEPVWFIADSYFMEYDVERWPYYMMQEGVTHWFADNLPGGGSEEFLECFKEDLKYGTPKVAVWMMGMNDYDDEADAPHPVWLACVEEFISLCEARDITPVIVSVPTVPERCHDRKAEWVRNSGYRYVDWTSAVGAKPWDGSEEDMKALSSTGKHRGWDNDYLYEDGVHPSATGAEALWQQVKKDIPELK